MPTPTDRLAERDRRTPAARRLELLRSRRTRPQTDPSLSPALTSIATQLQLAKRDAGPMGQLFNELIPELLARSAKLRIDRGTLRISVPDSASRFALDRLLRAGIEQQLIRRSPVPIRAVRVEATSSPSSPTGAQASTTRSSRTRSS